MDEIMASFEMKLTQAAFEAIASGRKTIESRLFDEKRSVLKVGDVIEFSMADNLYLKIAVKIKELHRFATFAELFSAFPAENFGGSSKEDLLENIRNFYSTSEEKKFGVVGIVIEKI